MKLDTIRDKATIKLVRNSVLTLPCRRAIIIKSPRESETVSLLAQRGSVAEKRETKKSQKNFQKGIDKEKFL